jgi:hypothetical protein
VIKRPLPDPLPPYARQTAASIVGGVMKSPEVLESRDQGSIGRLVQDKVGQHEKHLQVGRQYGGAASFYPCWSDVASLGCGVQEERQIDPERFIQEPKIMNPDAKPKSAAPQVGFGIQHMHCQASVDPLAERRRVCLPLPRAPQGGMGSRTETSGMAPLMGAGDGEGDPGAADQWECGAAAGTPGREVRAHGTRRPLTVPRAVRRAGYVVDRGV